VAAATLAVVEGRPGDDQRHLDGVAQADQPAAQMRWPVYRIGLFDGD